MGKNLDCPKALSPLAISGSSWQLGCGSWFWLEECAHRIKSHHIFFFTLGFCGSREISHVPHMNWALRKPIIEWEEDSMSTVWPSAATHIQSSGHCLVMSKLATISHKDTKYVSLLRVVEWGKYCIANCFLLSSSLCCFLTLFKNFNNYAVLWAVIIWSFNSMKEIPYWSWSGKLKIQRAWSFPTAVGFFSWFCIVPALPPLARDKPTDLISRCIFRCIVSS